MSESSFGKSNTGRKNTANTSIIVTRVHFRGMVGILKDRLHPLFLLFFHVLRVATIINYSTSLLIKLFSDSIRSNVIHVTASILTLRGIRLDGFKHRRSRRRCGSIQ